MRRIVVLIVLAVAAAAPAAARADGGPAPLSLQGGAGVASPDGKLRYVAVPGVNETVVESIARDGSVVGWASVAGQFGIPSVVWPTTGAGGLSADGSTLVLAPADYAGGLRASTTFRVLDTKRLYQTDEFTLRGDFAYDALSPDARYLYLIRHTSARDFNRYVVRRYDLVADRLEPGRIADRTQRGWVMDGYPIARVTSPDGRWVYTLYGSGRIGGFPFVHALDTVRGVAHCTGIPWRGSQNAVWNMQLALRDGGRTLAVHWRSGRRYLTLDTRTWRIAPARAPFPWPAVAGGAGGAAALVAAAAVLLLRRRRRARLGDALLAELRDALEREPAGVR